ncbi:hypothetical protein GJ496_006134 [Pomphorhynchus laevis]|nr:hypothetical protein GJ496_006134 [Pomphorhynchus laevis]
MIGHGNLGRGHLGRGHLGRGHLGRDHLGRDHLGRDHLGRDHLGRDHLGRDHLGRDHLGRDHLGRGHLGRSHLGHDNLDRGHLDRGRDHLGRDHLGRDHLGRDHLGRDHLGRDHLGRDHLGRDHLGRDHLGRDHLGRDHLGRDHLGRDHLGRGHLGRDHLGRDHLGRDHLGRDHLGRDHLGRDHLGRDHLGRDHLGRDHLGRDHLGRDHLGRDHLGRDHLGRDHLGRDHLGRDHLGRGHLGRSHLGHDNLDRGHLDRCHLDRGQLGLGRLGRGQLGRCHIGHIHIGCGHINRASQVYRNLTFDRLLKLCPGEDKDDIDSQSIISKYVAQMSRSNVIEVRINDRAKSLTFSSDLCAIPPERRDVGPTIQSYPQDIIRSQLQRMSKLSMKIVLQIHGPRINRANKIMRKKVIDDFRKMDARTVVSERSERIEMLKSIQEKVACRRKENQELAARRLEQIRLKEEQQRREAEIKRRAEERKNEMKRLQTKQNMSFVLQTDFGRKELADKTPEELLNIDISALQQKQQEKELKAERERRYKLNAQYKKVDYTVRAFHSEEIRLYSAYIQNYLANRKRHRQEMEKEILETAKEERERELTNKDRFLRMCDAQKLFYDKLLNERKQEYESRLKDYQNSIDSERQRLLLDRKVKRKAARKAAYEKQKAEVKAIELAKKKREEDERQRQLQENRRLIEEEKLNKYKKQMDMQQKSVPAVPTAFGSSSMASSKLWRHGSGASVSMTSFGSKTMRQPSTGNFMNNQSSFRWPSKFNSVRQNTSRTDRRPMDFERPSMDRSKGLPNSNIGVDITKLSSWRSNN